MKRVLLYTLIALTRAFSDLPLLWMFYFLHFQKEGSGGVSDTLFNAALLISFGVIHSLLARNFAKKFMARLVGENFVRIVYVFIAGITLFLVLYLWRAISGEVWRTDGLLYWILSILYLGCIAGMVYTTFFIDYLDFLGIRALLRTMKNRPAKSPVFSAKGPYAYCRHPMYLFLLVALWMGPVMTYGRLEFALLGSIYLIIGTFFEERNLREELGEVYNLYRENVPMWIPRLRPMLKFSSKESFTCQKLVILCFLALVQFSPVLAQSEFPQVPDTVKAGAVIKQFTSFRAGNKLVDAECGYVIVPENRSNTNSNLIKVAFVRFKSKLSKSLPPIFFIGGGPGRETIQYARDHFINYDIGRWTAGDVIVFDQRGVGESLPSLACREYDFQHDKPYSREEINEIVAQSAVKCRARLVNQGIDLTGYNTCEIVEDIETLRVGLGYDKINLLSVSYGTLVAFTYIKRHGSKVNRAIPDGFQRPVRPYLAHIRRRRSF